MKTVEEVRRDMPVLSKFIFLNAGTLNPGPEPVTQAFFKAYQDWIDRGAGLPEEYRGMRDARVDEARVKLAAFLNCDPDELAFTANCSEGVNIIANGINWRPGDEVIISDREHAANSAIWMHLRHKTGLRVRIIRMSVYDEPILTQLRQLLSPRTRLVALSHVSTFNGQILPVQEVCRLTRAAGALSLIDGAHAPGQIPVDLHALGCDYYTTNGHKWLMGPAGTGALYLRRDSLEQISPSWLGDAPGGTIDYREEGSYTLSAGAKRFEFSTRCWPLFLAWADAIDYVNDIGMDNIRQRVKTLVGQLLDDLRTIPGLALWSPTDPERVIGLVSFVIAGWESDELMQLLKERGIRVRTIDKAIRVSIGYFTLAEELTALTDALREIVQAGH